MHREREREKNVYATISFSTKFNEFSHCLDRANVSARFARSFVRCVCMCAFFRRIHFFLFIPLNFSFFCTVYFFSVLLHFCLSHCDRTNRCITLLLLLDRQLWSLKRRNRALICLILFCFLSLSLSVCACVCVCFPLIRSPWIVIEQYARDRANSHAVLLHTMSSSLFIIAAFQNSLAETNRTQWNYLYTQNQTISILLIETDFNRHNRYNNKTMIIASFVWIMIDKWLSKADHCQTNVYSIYY